MNVILSIIGVIVAAIMGAVVYKLVAEAKKKNN
jgi:hypothetical protein